MLGCPRASVHVSHGSVTFSNEDSNEVHPYGTTATASCNENYEISGSRIRVCQSNGEWSHSNVECTTDNGILKNCGEHIYLCFQNIKTINN